MQIQESVRRESLNVLKFCGGCCLAMFLIFFVLHRLVPEQVPFDYRVILGGVLGTCVASLNFFLMGITVQKVANTEDKDIAYQTMKASYRNRNLMQIIWIVICMVVPVIQIAAGIIPLFFPSIMLKGRGVLHR